MATEIKFRRDTSFRKTLFSADSFAHPAKMDAQLLLWIVERYTKAGETILDPMAGSGTAMIGCTVGRNIVQVELEQKFVEMQKTNWDKVRMMPQLGHEMGECHIIQGDARQLGDILADHAIFSPPYAESYIGGDGSALKALETGKGTKRGRGFDSFGNKTLGKPDNPENIGNLKADNYLSAMAQVYSQCHRVLKPGGLMVVVTKNFIRNKKEVRLDEDTIRLCEPAGFKFVERHYRKLPAQSFWRVIYQQKYPDAPVLDKEDILVFKKVAIPQETR